MHSAAGLACLAAWPIQRAAVTQRRKAWPPSLSPLPAWPMGLGCRRRRSSRPRAGRAPDRRPVRALSPRRLHRSPRERLKSSADERTDGCPRDAPTRPYQQYSSRGDDLFADPRTGVALAVNQSRNVRSRCRCSVCPAIHINSRSWLRSSSTHEPSDPPHRVVSVLNRGRPPAQHGRKSCALAPESSDPETCVQRAAAQRG